MSKDYYPPEKRYKITIYLKNQSSVSSEMNNVGILLHKVLKKRFYKWILLPTSDSTPDLFVRRSEVAFIAVSEAKSKVK